jgi:hypothetical protein
LTVYETGLHKILYKITQLYWLSLAIIKNILQFKRGADMLFAFQTGSRRLSSAGLKGEQTSDLVQLQTIFPRSVDCLFFVTIQRTRRCSRRLEKGVDCVVGRVAVLLGCLDD